MAALPTDSAPAVGGRGAPLRSSARGLFRARAERRTKPEGGRAAARRAGSLALPPHARSVRASWALRWTKQPAEPGIQSRSRAWGTAEPLRPLPPAGGIWLRWGREPRLLLRPEPRFFQRA